MVTMRAALIVLGVVLTAIGGVLYLLGGVTFVVSRVQEMHPVLALQITAPILIVGTVIGGPGAWILWTAHQARPSEQPSADSQGTHP
jgi:predicted membrane channel-forming protein YqfA (hemolysin III family)